MNIFILEKQDRRFKKENVWKIQGVYLTYKLAQDNFIYKDGGFRIRMFEVQKR